MSNKLYYLFGSEAAEMYNDWNKSEEELLKVFIEDSLDYDLFVYDELSHHPSDLLSAYDGWGGFAQITESFYNLLKTQ
jgi:Rps23 Pro-64 3,4-dihydroxylase Tpa1-like proline 4-hydroxylase